jgi:hypothetical protein
MAPIEMCRLTCARGSLIALTLNLWHDEPPYLC